MNFQTNQNAIQSALQDMESYISYGKHGMKIGLETNEHQ